MHICCLDLEGVLLPEIWIQVAEKTKIKELRLTTRDLPDYDALMRQHLAILKREGIRLRDIQEVISKIKPLTGAKDFLDKLRSHVPVIILTDSYYEFILPLVKSLGFPTVWCNWLSVDQKGFIANYFMRQQNGKEKAVLALQEIGFKVKAAGDSYNDITMLKAADEGILFNPPDRIIGEYPQFKVAKNYNTLLKSLTCLPSSPGT